MQRLKIVAFTHTSNYLNILTHTTTTTLRPWPITEIVRVRPLLNSHENTNSNINKSIFDHMEIIILIVKEFIRILENKYNYSNIKTNNIEVRVKLQDGIKPVK